MKATWETSPGHPSADGKLLLREGGAPGRLELWEIGSADKDARTFEYKSPLCAGSLADDKGNIRFDNLFIADGVSEEGQPFGSYSTNGYVAQDCTPVTVAHISFKTEKRAREELEREVREAVEVLEKSPPKEDPQQVFVGERRVLRFAGRGPAPGPFMVIWLQGNSVTEIHSPSLPAALAMEKTRLQKW